MTDVVVFGDTALSIEDIWNVARGTSTAQLSPQPDVQARITRSANVVSDMIRSGAVIYGINTGYGDSCETQIPAGLVADLPLNLTRYHRCGLGRILSAEETRSTMAVRLSNLLQGWSGASWDLVALLAAMLQHDILPEIPAEGSVGASGDLTPLSYVAAALAGEGFVVMCGERLRADVALAKAGLKPIVLRPKEALAVMNGTAVMTGLAVLVYKRAEWLALLASRLSAMAALGLMGNAAHFDARLALAKPHPGQVKVTARIRADLAGYEANSEPSRIQDRYSIRCAPHVIGVLEDMLPAFRKLIETEINSANDNPLFDPIDGRALHGGHFYGGHIAFAMDGLKTLCANVADLLDRQLALLVDTRYSNGLPQNLSGSTGPRAAINHGLKAVQIAVSAWTAEALKQTMPASVFSRSTECHNQDKVSMGTIAARDAERVLELSEQVCAANLIATLQAVRLRQRAGELTAAMIGPRLERFIAEAGEDVPLLNGDIPLDTLLARLCDAVRTRSFALEDIVS
jgi:histidine ammonia-lyase